MYLYICCIYIYIYINENQTIIKLTAAFGVDAAYSCVSTRSSFEWNTPPYDVPDMHAKPGTPCSNYNGYCDVFQKCREVRKPSNKPLAPR